MIVTNITVSVRIKGTSTITYKLVFTTISAGKKMAKKNQNLNSLSFSTFFGSMLKWQHKLLMNMVVRLPYIPQHILVITVKDLARFHST